MSTCPRSLRFWEESNGSCSGLHEAVIRAVEALIAAGKRELGLDYLTYFSRTELLNSLDLAETLADALEARTRALHGFKLWPTPAPIEQ